MNPGLVTSALLLVTGIVPLPTGSEMMTDHVTLVEINHHYDDQCKLIFEQVIFYDWDDLKGRFQVVDWRLLKCHMQIPKIDHRLNRYVAVWYDFKQKDVLRKTVCLMVKETWTQYDPELAERSVLGQEQRRKLSQSK